MSANYINNMLVTDKFARSKQSSHILPQIEITYLRPIRKYSLMS